MKKKEFPLIGLERGQYYEVYDEECRPDKPFMIGQVIVPNNGRNSDANYRGIATFISITPDNKINVNIEKEWCYLCVDERCPRTFKLASKENINLLNACLNKEESKKKDNTIFVFHEKQPCLDVKTCTIEGPNYDVSYGLNRDRCPDNGWNQLRETRLENAKKVPLTLELKQILLEDLAYAYGNDSKVFSEKLKEFKLI